MNNTQTACFALLASAFLLAAILIVGIGTKSQDNTAQADGQVVTQTGFTLMTARTRGTPPNAEESLFILDSGSGVILVYKPNVGQRGLEPVAVVRMNQLFGG